MFDWSKKMVDHRLKKKLQSVADNIRLLLNRILNSHVSTQTKYIGTNFILWQLSKICKSWIIIWKPGDCVAAVVEQRINGVFAVLVIIRDSVVVAVVTVWRKQTYHVKKRRIKTIASKGTAKSCIMGAETAKPIATKFCTSAAGRDVITHANFLKIGKRVITCRRSEYFPFSIDFIRRLFNILALPCECATT